VAIKELVEELLKVRKYLERNSLDAIYSIISGKFKKLNQSSALSMKEAFSISSVDNIVKCFNDNYSHLDMSKDESELILLR